MEDRRSGRRLFPGFRADVAALLAAAIGGAIPTFRARRKRQKFTPCRGCGNLARHGYCFKCETKNRQATPRENSGAS